jgi:lipoyl(octanoyl) transferase
VASVGEVFSEACQIMQPLEVRRLGRISYGEALSLQQTLVEERRAGRVGDLLLLLEHPHVITLGVKREVSASHVVATPEALTARGIEIVETGRGGDVTYHGPGQIVGYPILNLNPDRRDVHRYVRDLEEVMIRTAADFGVAAVRIRGLTGVWVGADKLGAIGVRISRWITSHGFAFNVMTDLTQFDLIVPCGLRDRGVTSLARLLGRPVNLNEVETMIARRFSEVFDRSLAEEPMEATSGAGRSSQRRSMHAANDVGQEGSTVGPLDGVQAFPPSNEDARPGEARGGGGPASDALRGGRGPTIQQ